MAAYSGVCNEGVIIRISKVIVRCYLNIAFDYFLYNQVLEITGYIHSYLIHRLTINNIYCR